MNTFNVYKVLAKTPTADRAYFTGSFLDDDAAGARAQAEVFMKENDIPLDESTQLLVALCHE